MIPEAKLIRSETMVRDLVLSEDVRLTRKALIRWLALALGLMAPNESRQLLLDVLEGIFYFHVHKQNPTTVQILEKMEQLTNTKPNTKAVYYHLLNLKNIGILHRKKGRYYLSEEEGKGLAGLLRNTYEKRFQQAFISIEEGLGALENNYKGSV